MCLRYLRKENILAVTFCNFIPIDVFTIVQDKPVCEVRHFQISKL